MASNKKEKVKQGGLAQILVSGVLILVLVGVGLLLYFEILNYWAEIYHSRASRALNQGKFNRAVQLEGRAINLAPVEDRYYRSISRIYLVRLQRTINRQDISQQQRRRLVQAFVAGAVNTAGQATAISEHNVANWASRGFVYRNLMNLAQDADQWAVKSYNRAIELESTNPYLYTELARVYIAKANLARQAKNKKQQAEALGKARENLEQAINLKRDYWPAHFQEVVVFDRQGNLDQAIKKMESIAYFNPQDQNVIFRLGMLYWRKNDLKKASQTFKRAVQLSPNFANARYFLGLIYDKQGEKQKAIAEFEKIASLSEANKKKVADILKNLRAGKPALGPKKEIPEQPEEIPKLEEKSKPEAETPAEKVPSAEETPPAEETPTE